MHHWTKRNGNPMGKTRRSTSGGCLRVGQTAYHSVSARLAYLALDRPDLAFACKECSRAVGKATRADLTRLKRIGRYLLYTPRAVWEFTVQYEESIVLIDGLSDADAAGCPKTRRSTSGGCLRVGQHTLATWSSTQKVVSLSSGVTILQHGTLCK